MQTQVTFDEWLHSRREWDDSTFGLRAVGSAFPIDHQSVGLPVNVVLLKSGQFGDSKAGVKQRPDKSVFLDGSHKHLLDDSLHPGLAALA